MDVFYAYSPQGIGWFYVVMLAGAAIMAASAFVPKINKHAGRKWYYGVTVLTVSFILLSCVWVYQQAHASVTVTYGKKLTVHAGLTSPDLLWEEIDTAEVRRVNWKEDRGLRPVGRDFGTGLNGFMAGWFTLADGDKAFAVLVKAAPQDSTVMVPVHKKDGKRYRLLLSLQDAGAFIEAVKK